MDTVEAKLKSALEAKIARFNAIQTEAIELRKEIDLLNSFMPKPPPTATATATQPATTVDGRNMSLTAVILDIMSNVISTNKVMGANDLVPLIKASGYRLHSKQQVYCALSELVRAGKLRRVVPGEYRRRG